MTAMYLDGSVNNKCLSAKEHLLRLLVDVDRLMEIANNLRKVEIVRRMRHREKDTDHCRYLD